MDKVFLGGTCNKSTWREDLIWHLEADSIDYFNPVVEDWTPECQKEEYRQKDEECNIHLYVITAKMTGSFSIAEAVDSAHKLKERCLFQVVDTGLDVGQYKSLKAVAELIDKIGGNVYLGTDFIWIPKAIKSLKNK